MISMLRKPREIDPVVVQRQIERGQRAENLLRDDTFREALEHIESVYLRAWRASEQHDVETRERAHIAVCLLDDLKNLLIGYVRDGVVAQDLVEKSLRQ